MSNIDERTMRNIRNSMLEQALQTGGWFGKKLTPEQLKRAQELQANSGNYASVDNIEKFLLEGK